VTRLTTQGSCFSPSWSPDGVHIAYKVESNGPSVPDDSAGIWMIDVRTLQRRQLSRFLGTRPSWSPRGDRLAISAALATSAPYDEIALTDTVSGPLVRLTSNAVDDEAPAWSPDGALIAWSSNLGSVSGIWLMNADGSSPHLLTPVGGYPSWSPDGNFIVYGGFDPTTNVQSLWVIGSDGRGARKLPY
jgi:TolB protein